MFDRNLVFHTVLYSVYRLQIQIQKALSRFENEYVVYQGIRLGKNWTLATDNRYDEISVSIFIRILRIVHYDKSA